MIVTICIVLIVVSFVAKIYYSHSKYMKNIPKLDLARGSIFDVLLGGTEAILPSLEKYIDTYGPIIKLYFGPVQIGVIASDEKFLDHILNSNKVIDKPDQFEFVHNWIGTGLLTSTGQKFAILEMKTILSKILRNFELLPARPVHEPRFIVEIVMVSKNGVCIAIKKRVYP